MRRRTAPRVSAISAIGRPYGPALLSAVMCLLVGPPARLTGLVWVACVPLFLWLTQRDRQPREAWIGSWLVGAAYYAGLSWPFLSLSWWAWGSAEGVRLVSFLFWQKLLMGLIVFGLCAWGGVFWGACGWLVTRFRSPGRALWAIPCLWVLVVEVVGYRTVGGISWGRLGYQLHESVWLRQLASLTGVIGLSFLILLANATLAGWWRAILSGPHRPAAGGIRGPLARALRAAAEPGVRGMVVGCGVVLIAAVLYGHARVASVNQLTGEAIRVAVLQGNVVRHRPDDFTAVGLDRTYGPMLDAALADEPDLLVLPEAVWLRRLRLDASAPPDGSSAPPVSVEELGRVLGRKLRGRSTVLVHGIDAVSAGRVYNAMAFWSAEGLVDTYFKQRLVPFAEYRPAGLGWLAPTNLLHGSGFGYASGRATAPVTVEGLAIGSFICQELMYPALVRERAAGGAEVLVTIGNDGIFASPWVARQFAAMAVLRTVEHGRFLVRSMKTGVSGIIDPAGRVLGQARTGQRAIVASGVVPLRVPTAYTKWGEWVVWPCAIFLAALAAPARARGPRRLLRWSAGCADSSPGASSRIR